MFSLKTVKNLLGDYIARRRDELNLSQSELGRKAGVSHSYIRQLEMGFNPSTGRPISPTASTLEKLAKGLRVDVDTLARLARGEEPKTPALPSEPQKTLLGLVNEFGQVEYPPTPHEQAVYDESMRLGFPGWPTLTEPGFWSRPPEDRLRRSTFRNIEASVDDAKAFYVEEGNG